MGVPIQLIDIDVPFAWEVPDLLDEPGCAELLRRTAGRDWLAATVNAREGRIVRPELRDADVCFWRDPELAASLLERLPGSSSHPTATRSTGRRAW